MDYDCEPSGGAPSPRPPGWWTLLWVAFFISAALVAAAELARAAEAPLPDTREKGVENEVCWLEPDGRWLCRVDQPAPTRTYEPGTLTGDRA